MTRVFFLNRLSSMKVNADKSDFEQIASRLYQCSFIRRNHVSVSIPISKIRFQLIETFEKKLIGHYRMLVKNGSIEPSTYSFTINNFDLFIQNFLDSFDETFLR